MLFLHRTPSLDGFACRVIGRGEEDREGREAENEGGGGEKKKKKDKGRETCVLFLHRTPSVWLGFEWFC